MDSRKHENFATEILKFLSVLKDIIDKSYIIEFSLDSDKWLDDDSEVVLVRGALFTLAKDAFQNIQSMQVKKLINQCINQIQAHGALPNFIDKIVGGHDGKGQCLQSATNSLLELHNQIVNVTEIDNIYKFKKENYIKPEEYVEKNILKFNERSHISNNKKDISPKKKTEISDSDRFREDEYGFYRSRNVKRITLYDKVQMVRDKNQPAYKLLEAIHKNDINSVNILLKKNSINDLQGKNIRNEGNFHPPLHMACEEGKFEIVKILLQNGFAVNMCDENGGRRTAISYAIEMEHKDIVELLINANADMTIKDNFDQIPIDWAPNIKEDAHSAPVKAATLLPQNFAPTHFKPAPLPEKPKDNLISIAINKIGDLLSLEMNKLEMKDRQEEKDEHRTNVAKLLKKVLAALAKDGVVDSDVADIIQGYAPQVKKIDPKNKQLIQAFEKLEKDVAKQSKEFKK